MLGEFEVSSIAAQLNYIYKENNALLIPLLASVNFENRFTNY
jgi:hypothetical protein